MNNGLRKHLKQIPYFLLFNYPGKLEAYRKICEKNKKMEDAGGKIKPNAYHSPSPMNELCDYICTWEKKNILWDSSIKDLADTRSLIIDHKLSLQDRHVIRICRRYINGYAQEIKKHINMRQEKPDNEDHKFHMEAVAGKFRKELENELDLSEELIANYVIKTSYSNMSVSKALAWSAYGGYIIGNLKNNTGRKKNISIKEVPHPTDISYEYLGKYYEFEEGDSYLQL